MRQDLADLNEERVAGDDVDPDVVNRLFRSAHSLKGLAGLFGFDPIQDLAHRVEDILDGLRLGRVRLELPVVALIDESVHAVREPARADRRPGCARRRDRADRPARGADPGCARGAHRRRRNSVSSTLDPLAVACAHRVRRAPPAREHPARSTHLPGRRRPSRSSPSKRDCRDLSVGDPRDGGGAFDAPHPGRDPGVADPLLAAGRLPTLPAGEVVSRLGLSPGAVRSGAGGSARGSPAPRRPGPGRRAGAVPVRRGVRRRRRPAPPRGAARASAPESLKSISDTVRVDIHKLDELMNLVGELVIQRGAIGELVARLAADSATARIGNDFAKLHKALDRKLRELQSAVLDVRMVPLSAGLREGLARRARACAPTSARTCGSSSGAPTPSSTS